MIRQGALIRCSVAVSLLAVSVTSAVVFLRAPAERSTPALIARLPIAPVVLPSAPNEPASLEPTPTVPKILTSRTDPEAASAADLPDEPAGPVILASASAGDSDPPAMKEASETEGPALASPGAPLPPPKLLPSASSDAASPRVASLAPPHVNKSRPSKVDAHTAQTVEAPRSSQQLLDPAASVPSPLHWDLIRDLPSVQGRTPDTVPEPTTSNGSAKLADSAGYATAEKGQDAAPTMGNRGAPFRQPLVEEPRAMAALDDSWQEPTALIESVRALASTRATSPWAAEALRQIHAIGQAINGRSDRSLAILQRLDRLSRDAADASASMSDRATAGRLRRTAFALARRVAVWQQLVKLHASPAPSVVAKQDAARLRSCLAAVNTLTGTSPEGLAWQRYLLVDSMRDGLARRPTAENSEMRQTAQRALARLTQMPLSVEQQQFVALPPIAALRDELRPWAAEPIGAAALLRDIERYEMSGLPSDSRCVAMDCLYLAQSPVEGRRQLAATVAECYRSANFRMAVTERLLNDLMPERDMEYMKISESVQGRPTHGESLMASEAGFRMIPDAKRVRLALVVAGKIEANTMTDAGAAKFFNESETWYIARKPLEIDMKGISVWPAEVDVYNDTQLKGVDTKLGNVPVLGMILSGLAERQYNMNKSAANEEVRQRVVQQASERVDAEAKKQLSSFVGKMNQRVFEPLNCLSLYPEMIDAETTKERFTMRLRVGGEDQVGGHTPRPIAPADSLASVQLHESVLNNGLRRLQLEGRTFTVPELAQHVAASLNCSPWQVSPDNEDVKITFASQDAVVVRCRDGAVMLTFSVQRLSKGSHRWNNFQVRAFYRPEVQGRSAKLARDGVIRLLGPRLNTGSQIALRGIFSHALSKKTPFELIPKQIVDDPKLKDAAITQFLLEDGWLGIAIGPRPTAVTAQRGRRAAG